MRLAGTIAIITSASSVFGRATVVRFAEEGAKLVLGDIATEAGAGALIERALACFGTTDVADAIVYLSSDEAGYVTGQELVVDGGYLAS